MGGEFASRVRRHLPLCWGPSARGSRPAFLAYKDRSGRQGLTVGMASIPLSAIGVVHVAALTNFFGAVRQWQQGRLARQKPSGFQGRRSLGQRSRLDGELLDRWARRIIVVPNSDTMIGVGTVARHRLALVRLKGRVGFFHRASLSRGLEEAGFGGIQLQALSSLIWKGPDRQSGGYHSECHVIMIKATLIE